LAVVPLFSGLTSSVSFTGSSTGLSITLSRDSLACLIMFWKERTLVS
jgi:hypothetical protein